MKKPVENEFYLINALGKRTGNMSEKRALMAAQKRRYRLTYMINADTDTVHKIVPPKF